MGGQLVQQPKMSLEQATSGAGLKYDPISNMYYKPSTGQFYQSGTAARQNDFAAQLFGLFGNMPGAFGQNQEPENVINYGGYRFNPFTGTAEGVTNGFFSPIGRFSEPERTYAPPVGILNQLFGGIDFSNVGQSTGSGAARFMSGPTK